jgi:phosphomannomutase
MASPSSALIATHSGLRGRPGVDLSPELTGRTVSGLIGVLDVRGLPRTLAVARDERQTSEALAATVIDAALVLGTEVVDLGVLSTPAAKLAARRRQLGGAVIVTGSHLDPALNGLKLVAGPSYGPVDVRGLPQPEAGARRRGRLHLDHAATAEHVAAVSESIDADLVRGTSLSVRSTGSAGAAPRLLLERLRCRTGEPHPQVGLLLDSDGDRLLLIDETGARLDSDETLALALLAHDARVVVKGADTSRMIDTLAKERGGAIHTVAPGEIHLISALVEQGGDLGGEGNGGVVVPSVCLGRDGLAAAAAILWLVARSDRPLSALAAELPRYARRRSTLSCPDEARGREAIAAVAGRWRTEPEPDTGLRVETGEGAWGLVRVSATEPVVRITAEADTASGADSLHTELRSAIARELALR